MGGIVLRGNLSPPYTRFMQRGDPIQDTLFTIATIKASKTKYSRFSLYFYKEQGAKPTNAR